MIGWMMRLCALCSMSALLQMMMAKDDARSALKMICGLLMLHMTCESTQTLIAQMTSGESLMQLLSYLMK